METEPTAVLSAREQVLPYAGIRSKDAEQWVDDHGPGTLRKAKRLGYSWRKMYLHDRVAHEWGWEFRITQKSRVTFGDAFIEGDEPALTEACWHQERHIALNRFPDSDSYESKYLYVDPGDGGPKLEGVGLILRRTSAAWLPPGHIVYCIIARYNVEKGKWKKARNPS